ncbi:hypothetical protein [Streptomyces sp. SAS_270]|uniref:hypothetical protein n=1 Tax=Streptomyces sp. SAS_270 TaxID=3412748 RepID=UPI00403C9D10
MLESDDDMLFRLLGLMVVQAGYLECAVGELAAELTGEDREGPILSKAPSQNIATCKAEAVRQETPERCSALGAILDKCTAAFERRHQYVHGHWIYTIGGAVPKRNTWRVRRNGDVLEKAISAEDLQELVDTISHLSGEVYHWMGED